MKLLTLLSTMVLFALPCTAQEPVTLELNNKQGLTIDTPQDYTVAGYAFGPVPDRDGQAGQGLTIALDAGQGLIFYGPPIETGPGEVLVECTIRCTGPDVGLALVAMNLPDYSMMANLPASGEKYSGGWHTVRLLYDPDDDSLMLGFQAVSKGTGTTVVYVDQIVVTSVGSLSDEEIVSLFKQTDTPGTGITIDLPGLPSDAKPLEMMLIQPGTFRMGSPPDERGRGAGEYLHDVTLTQAFYIGTYEVTQAQWRAVMGSDPEHSSFGNYGRGDDYPVYYVPWNDCQTFITRLNLLDLGWFRLPTEAEWEYTCRAGADTRYSFGDALECSDSRGYCELMDEYVWWGGNNSSEGLKEVGLKLPNPWGLYDMHGNAEEWCLDRYGPYPGGSQTDPQGPTTGSSRIRRGGYFYGNAVGCRSATRGSLSPSVGYSSSGLRLVREHP